MTVRDGISLLEVRVRNFRSLKAVNIHLNEATVLVGENNSGKSAVIDAIRLALSLGDSRRGIYISESDFHRVASSGSPTASAISTNERKSIRKHIRS